MLEQPSLPCGEERTDRLSDEPYVARKSRPSDLLVATPVVLAVTAIAMFFFSVMSESDGLRTVSLTMVPVTAGSFVAAPLFVMLRSRDRDRN